MQGGHRESGSNREIKLNGVVLQGCTFSVVISVDNTILSLKVRQLVGMECK